MNGIIFNIKRYSIHDGPGIRVTFFLKGCPLSCLWCHNPEGISADAEEIIQVNRVGEKEFSKKEIAGKQLTIPEMMTIVEKERVFIEKSGGGVTFSGGEPLMQTDFLLDALNACRENGFHTAVDTSGFTTSENLKKIIPLTNLFLFDLKHLDPRKHLQYTGVSNEIILRNLGTILSSDTEIMIRIPVIPGINDDPSHLAAMIGYLTSIRTSGIKMINLLPYHKSGLSKYKKFGRENMMGPVEQPSSERMKEISKLFTETGIKIKIGG
jgi:pyruvate formate lyase activating enzyme